MAVLNLYPLMTVPVGQVKMPAVVKDERAVMLQAAPVVVADTSVQGAPAVPAVASQECHLICTDWSTGPSKGTHPPGQQADFGKAANSRPYSNYLRLTSDFEVEQCKQRKPQRKPRPHTAHHRTDRSAFHFMNTICALLNPSGS